MMTFFPSRGLTVLLLAHIVFGSPAIFSRLAFAQGAEAEVAQPPEQPPPNDPADTDKEAAAKDSLREQTIYVPYDKLRKVFEQQGRGVFLPYEEFQRLWKNARAAATPTDDDQPPVAALVTEIRSTATIENEVVNVTAELKIEVLTAGWHEIPLRLTDAAILSARLGDRPASIVYKPKSGYVLLFRKTGNAAEQMTLALEYSKAFEKTPGRNRFSVQAPQAAVNRWLVRVPQAGVQVHVEPMIAATEQPSADPEADPAGQETVVLAFVGAAPVVRLDWTPKAEGASGLAALATVQAQQQVSLDEGVIRSRIVLDYQISRAELTSLRIQSPADFKVLNVFDPNVKQWSVDSDDTTSTITVSLYEPSREYQQIVLELEKFAAGMTAGPVAVPSVKALDAGRQQGVVVVRVAPALRADTADRSGLLQMDAAELPAGLAGGDWTFAYRYAALPFALSMNVEKVEPRITTRELVEAYLEPETVTFNLLALLTIERAGVFQIELAVPAGFDVRQVRGDAAAGSVAVAVDSYDVVPAGDPAAVDADDSGQRRLLVNLSRKALGVVGLFVELQRRLDEPALLSPTGQSASIPLPLPRVAPADLEHATGRLIVYAPESLRVNPTVDDGVQPISFAAALEGLASTRGGRFAGARQVLAYAYTREPLELSLAVQRRQPHVAVGQLLAARIESGVVKYEATFKYDILYSGVKSLRLDVPADWAGEIRNQSSPVIRDETMNPQPDDVADGYVAWSLSGETEFSGTVTIRFAWDRKMAELPIGSSTEISLPVLRPRAADRAWGQVVLAKAETLDVQVSRDASSGLRPIDPQFDLMQRPDTGDSGMADAALAFEFHGDWSLAATVTRYELEEVKHTSIERSVVRMEVTRSDVISVQALYRMRSARQRLAVQLPDEASFDTQPLRINGRPEALEQGAGNQYFIPLTGLAADAPFLIELRFTTPGNHRRLDLPSFPDEPAAQKVYLCAYLPQERALLASHGPWTSEMSSRWYEYGQAAPSSMSDREIVNWVVEGTSAANPYEDFATDGRLHTFSTLRPAPPPDGSLRLVAAKQNWLNGSIFGLIFVVGLTFVRRPVGQKLAVVTATISGLVLIGVFLPTLSRQVIGGAFWSAIAVVVAGWLVWYAAKVPGAVQTWWSQRVAARRITAASSDAGTTVGDTASPAEEDSGRPSSADASSNSLARETDDEQSGSEGGRHDA